jgi:hypothetical protein
MDYLPIQASAVPCERVFSSSAETDTKKQNWISLLLMEVLQMLKFHLKKERLNFTDGWRTSGKEMTEITPEEGLLQKLLDSSFRDAMDQVMQSISAYEDSLRITDMPYFSIVSYWVSLLLNDTTLAMTPVSLALECIVD